MSQFYFAHSIQCPRCHAKPGRWCRDFHNGGKAIAPHRERARAALSACGAVLRALPDVPKQNADTPNGQSE
jgi:hypothetical protein